MKANTKRISLIIAGVITLFIISFFGIKQYLYGQSKLALTQIDAAISAQELLLVKLADITRVNGADAPTERIIVDCKATQRQRFDVLLDSLSGAITAVELAELDTLFYKCGGFYADRKSVMATRLVREVQIFSDYITLRESLQKMPSDQSKKIQSWQALAEAELKTAEYFNSLVSLQGTIINELCTGKSSASPEIVATLGEVNKVRGQMVVLSKQIEVNKTEALAL